LRLASRHPDAEVTELFKAATVNGRRAMGIESDAADLAIWGVPPGANTREEIFNGMLANEPSLYAAFSRGNMIARAV
jgi:imidazolonepropionase-like amidohydrolase